MNAQNNAQNAKLSRRDFLKAAGLVTAAFVAPAVIESAQPTMAWAESTITCNAYCEPQDFLIKSVIGIKQGYLTNGTTPTNIFTGPYPNTPVENNATLISTNDDGTLTIRVPLVNTMFLFTGINKAAATDVLSDDGAALLTCGEPDANNYIDEITVTIPPSGTYVWSGATEYATPVAVAGDKSWPLYVYVG